jgi:hypothetical protein
MKNRLLALLAMLAVPFAAAADEGMWMPQQVPALADELKKLGLQLDPNSFADLTAFPMGAIVSLGGCSASFVSPEGLVATNHHCVAGMLQYNSTKENDLLKNGFLAKDKSQEIEASPGSRMFVTQSIEDVTKQILAPFPARTSDAERARTITRRRRQMIDECEKGGGKRCVVASFFEGGQYLKITQMEIRDVRLVYAPAQGVGNFGDETDNWMWPRHTGDFGFLRAYVGRDGKPADHSKDNVPYRPKHWLKISTRNLNPDDLVMVIGTPGVTKRHVTVSEVEAAEAFELPTSVRYRRMLAEILQARGKDDRDIALKNASRIAGLENYLKKHTGTLEAFERGDYADAKKERDAQDRAALTGELAAKYQAAEKELLALIEKERATRDRDLVLSWLYTSSPMLSQANTMYRLSVEKTKNDLDRAEAYTERNRKNLLSGVVRNRRNMEPGSDRAGLRAFLLEATKLPADQRIPPVDAALAATGQSSAEAQVDALLDRLYASTQIGNAEAETKMLEETTAQLRARKDSMIEFAASLREFAAKVDEAELAYSGAMSRIRPVMLDALRVARGGRLYPDANGTLRFGFGQVKGYEPRDAVWYSAQTDVNGVLQKDTGEVPFDSPKRLLERAKAKEFGPYVDPELKRLPVAFISTNVVTNGSSGSATLNAWGELCGLAFDSNWEGVGSDYVVEEEITRTIHVDSRYMLWVMDAVDNADNLLTEMGITPQL